MKKKYQQQVVESNFILKMNSSYINNEVSQIDSNPGFLVLLGPRLTIGSEILICCLSFMFCSAPS